MVPALSPCNSQIFFFARAYFFFPPHSLHTSCLGVRPPTVRYVCRHRSALGGEIDRLGR